MVEKISKIEEDKVKFLLDLWDTSYYYRKDTVFGKNAINFYDLYRGFHWDNTRIKKGKAAVVINKVGSLIEDIVSNVTDSPPSFDVIARKEELDQKAIDLVPIFNSYLWQTNNMTLENRKVVRNSLIYGSGFYQTWCEGSEQISPRIIKTKRLLPFSVFPEPGMESIQDSNYFIKATALKRISLLAKYGDRAKEVKTSSVVTYNFMPDFEKEAAKGFWSGIKKHLQQTYSTVNDVFAHKSNDNSFDECLLLEFWIKDLTVKDGKRVYPSWRYYVIAEDTLLEDKVWQYPFIPIIKVDDYSTDGFWGMSEIEWVESPQFLMNKFISQIANYMDLLANPILLTGLKSGIPDNWVNMPGSIARVRLDALEGTRFLNVPPLPSEFLVLLDRVVRLINDISGQHASPGMTTRTATQAAIFKEAEQQRTRVKVQNMEIGLTEWAYQCKEYIKKHWVTAQTIRFRNIDGQIITCRWSPEEEIDNYDLFIVAGSTLSSSRFLRLQELKSVPGIDAEEILKAINYPGWENVIKRIGEKENLIKEVQSLETQMQQMLVENIQLKNTIKSYIEGGHQ